MKLSDYGKELGLSYITVYRYWKQGLLNGYQLPTGTIIIDDKKPLKEKENDSK